MGRAKRPSRTIAGSSRYSGPSNDPGDVTAMLTIGVGFRVDLSGRENIRLGGWRLG